MKMNKGLSGVAIAAAVAVAFSSVPVISASADSGLVTCPGVNACKGQSDCRTTTNTCKVISEKGQNACKGQGFLMLTKAQCIKRGGHGVTYTVPPGAVNSQPYPSSSVDESDGSY